MLPMNNEGMMQIAYNVQSAVDDQNYLIADYTIENKKALYLRALLLHYTHARTYATAHLKSINTFREIL
jgi:hypothetical protein